MKKATEARARLAKDEKLVNQDAADFFSKLQIAKEKLPDEYEKYRMEVVLTTNVAAGSDTTSISLTAVMFFLASTPEAFHKLRTEVLEAEQRGDIQDPITFEQAQKLPYLQNVIKEALRMHPATGLPMWRVVQEPGMTIAGTLFPPGVCEQFSWSFQDDSLY